MTIDVFEARVETAQPPGVASIDVFAIRLQTAAPTTGPASIDVFSVRMETSGDSVAAQRYICWRGALIPILETGIAWKGSIHF